VIDQKHDDRADDGDDDAVEIEAGYSLSTSQGKQKSPDHRADDAEHNVQNHTLAGFVDDLASDEASNQAEDDPAMIDIGVSPMAVILAV
jgi:hypothetical protein